MKQIAFASGKGGAGKTVISAAFFDHIHKYSVLADCDVDASDAFILLEKDIVTSEKFESGYKYEIDRSKCIKCGACLEKCPFEAVILKNNEYFINELSCEGCGRCAISCKADAILRTNNYCGDILSSNTVNDSSMIYAKLFPAEDNSGKLASKVRMKSVGKLIKENRSIIVIDCPPGTGCPLTASIIGVDILVVIIECTMSGLSDAIRLMDLSKKMKIKTVCILNKTGLDKNTQKNAHKYMTDNNITCAGIIPFDRNINDLINSKKLITEINDHNMKNNVENIFENICIFSEINRSI